MEFPFKGDMPDLQTFWSENDVAHKAKPSKRKRIPIQFSVDDHYLLETLGIKSTLRYYGDFSYRMQTHRQMNDLMEAELGRRFFQEGEYEAPEPVRFEVLMGARWELREGSTPWLESSVQDEDDLDKIIEQAEKLDMKKVALPENWAELKSNWEEKSGKKLKHGGSFARGPATMATSILGTTNTCLFMMDEPERMDAFFDVLGRQLVNWHKVLMEATDNVHADGYALADDNCCLFPPAQYERFCAPVLKRLFQNFAPDPTHRRYQHSDSAMGHLMPILSELGVNAVNLGPTLHPLEIRKAFPNAEIHGHLAPMTLRNGTYSEIAEAVRRDIDAVGGDGRMVACTAGSMMGGTPMANLLTYIWAVDRYGRL